MLPCITSIKIEANKGQTNSKQLEKLCTVVFKGSSTLAKGYLGYDLVNKASPTTEHLFRLIYPQAKCVIASSYTKIIF